MALVSLCRQMREVLPQCYLGGDESLERLDPRPAGMSRLEVAQYHLAARAMEECGGCKKAAAKWLGVSRPTIADWLKRGKAIAALQRGTLVW